MNFWASNFLIEMNQVEAIYSIPFASVSLYATDLDGNATGSPVWSAACIEDVKIKDTQIIEYSAPTGCRYRIPHQVDEFHTITIDGLMDFSVDDSRNTIFVMYISWLQANRYANDPQRRWRDRSYFGVCETGLDSGGRGVNGSDGNAQSRSFSAQFYLQDTAVGGSPVGPASSVNA